VKVTVIGKRKEDVNEAVDEINLERTQIIVEP
jgi:hypothetical protein